MQKILLGICVFLVGISCNKVNTEISKLDGTYIGYFHRSRQDTTRVAIRFDGNSYQGKSTMQKYPAVGHGSFEQKDNIISFSDSLLWTPDFDRSLILKGDYNFTNNDDGTIRIWRQSDTHVDEYVFRRPSK